MISDFTEERNLSVARGGFTSLDEALAWCVQTYDRDFAGKEWASIEIRPVFTLSDNPEGGYHRWEACVHGQISSISVGARPE